jgi:hypothetical protein
MSTDTEEILVAILILVLCAGLIALKAFIFFRGFDRIHGRDAKQAPQREHNSDEKFDTCPKCAARIALAAKTCPCCKSEIES